LFHVWTFAKSKSSVALSIAKLASKGQSEAKRNKASVAVTLYFKMADTGRRTPKRRSVSDRVCSKESTSQPENRRSLRYVKRKEIMPRGETVV
jgi:hypothetical protein